MFKVVGYSPYHSTNASKMATVVDTRTRETFIGRLFISGELIIEKNSKPYIKVKDNKLVRTRKMKKIEDLEKFFSDLFMSIDMIEEDFRRGA